MVKNHLKSLAAPRTWPIERKNKIWITRPHSGAHSISVSLPLNIILRDLLKIAKTRKEVNYMINNSEVLVDGKKCTDKKSVVGIMDTLSFPIDKKYYRMILSSFGKLKLIEIPEKESQFKPSKIIGKKCIKGKVQLNLADGRNILINKNEYKTGGSLLIGLPSQKIIKNLPLQKESYIFLIGGKHLGSHGKVGEIQDKYIIFKSDKTLIKTLKKYAFVIGDKNSEITLG